MSSEYSVSVNDWSDEKWRMTGRDTMYSFYEKNPKEAEKDGHDVEDGKVKFIYEVVDNNHIPIMLYAYPLYSEPDEEDIIKICRETNCTVVEDEETGDFFLALTGGGMDLSQDVALAYLIAENNIPSALAYNVCKQEGLSKSGEVWVRVMEGCIDALTMEASTRAASEMKEAVEKFKHREVVSNE